MGSDSFEELHPSLFGVEQARDSFVPILFCHIGGCQSRVISCADQLKPWREHSCPAETEDHLPDFLLKSLFRSIEEWRTTEGILLQETFASLITGLYLLPVRSPYAGVRLPSMDCTRAFCFWVFLVRLFGTGFAQ